MLSSGEGAIFIRIQEAPLAPLEEVLLSAHPGELTLWRAPAEGWSFVGVGIAQRITAKGPERFVQIEQQAQKFFSRIIVEGEAPFSVRLFGGASFRGTTPPLPWGDFDSADFILPAWCYIRNQERAFIWTSPNLTRGREAAPSPFLKEKGDRGAVGEAEMPRELWSQLVQRALYDMERGALEKVVLSRCSKLALSSKPSLSLITRRMLSLYPSCAHFMMSRGESTFLGATPEKLVSLSRSVVKIDALAGSAPNNAEALLQNEKERREHQHVIDGIKTALAPLQISLDHAATPSVKVLPNVLHLHTPMQAKLSTPTHILSLVAALHPTPAVCGAPKESAMQWIEENEPHSRGWYAGPVGHFDANGEGSFFVAIRSALLQQDNAWLYSGAGLVVGSIPDREYEETAAKQRPMRDALGVNP